MKTWKIISVAASISALLLLVSFAPAGERRSKHRTTYRTIPKGCVYRTLMGEESSDSSFIYKTPAKVITSIEKGLIWLARAQKNNGGWGAGTHYRQDVMDPHAVEADPATTAIVAMALLRSGSTLTSGQYATHLSKALNFLLQAIESSSNQNNNITALQGTQIQTKLGANIDVIMTSQFLSNMLDHLNHNVQLKERVKKDLNICIAKIQKAQDNDGRIAGSGWAGVLQSSLAANALESAQAQGAKVDDASLQKSRDFQKNNYNVKTGDVNTDLGAGIMLYSVTGSARASAKEARKADEEVKKAQQSGRLSQNEPVSAESLEKIGFNKDEAMKYATAYQVYNSAKVKAQQDEVMDGFGSNGGEEFLSYLQTGESMIIGKDNDWTRWYDNIAGRMLRIQNDDGSWSGHHCITSPVFCTATCLLILSVNNDVENLVKMGGK